MNRKKLEQFANKGYQVAFKNKSNANQYIKELKERGYKHGIVRSSGPVVDSKEKRVVHAYYIIPHKFKSKVKSKSRRVSNPYSIQGFKMGGGL